MVGTFPFHGRCKNDPWVCFVFVLQSWCVIVICGFHEYPVCAFSLEQSVSSAAVRQSFTRYFKSLLVQICQKVIKLPSSLYFVDPCDARRAVAISNEADLSMGLTAGRPRFFFSTTKHPVPQRVPHPSAPTRTEALRMQTLWSLPRVVLGVRPTGGGGGVMTSKKVCLPKMGL